jgi:hypothetical protein
MKYIKSFKLYETGEWNRHIDWDYVKNDPDDDSDEVNWIKQLDSLLIKIIDNLDNPDIFEIIDIKGFDMYQGPYAKVKIFGRNYEIWIATEEILWIKDFPIDNSEENESPGFKGETYNISDLLNDITEAGGIEMFRQTNKYNL